MNKNSTLGEELVSAVEDALTNPSTGNIVHPKINVKELRSNLHLTQREFARRYHLSLETIKNWEQEKRTPDATGIAYLTCIAKNPVIIEKLLNN